MAVNPAMIASIGKTLIGKAKDFLGGKGKEGEDSEDGGESVKLGKVLSDLGREGQKKREAEVASPKRAPERDQSAPLKYRKEFGDL